MPVEGGITPVSTESGEDHNFDPGCGYSKGVMDILNKTPRPIKVPLPRGQVLRLGPRMTGQIAAKAAEFEAVKKLLEEGVIEIVGDGGTKSTGGSASGGDTGPSQTGPSGGGAMRRSGDR